MSMQDQPQEPRQHFGCPRCGGEFSEWSRVKTSIISGYSVCPWCKLRKGDFSPPGYVQVEDAQRTVAELLVAIDEDPELREAWSEAAREALGEGQT